MSIQWNIGYIVKKKADMNPEKNAIIFEDQPHTYNQLNEGVNKCAHLLQKMNIKKGDRVSLLLMNCIEFLEIYFACAKIGAIIVPLNWRLVGGELEYQLNDCGAKAIFFHDCFLFTLDLIRGHLKIDQDKFIYIKGLNPNMPDCPDWAKNYDDLIKNQPVIEPITETKVFFDDPIAIMYTSGVTGNPKGAILSHEQTYFKNFQISTYINSQADDIVVAQMPLFHSGGLFIVTTPCLNSGMTLIMRGGFDPNELAEDIQRYKGTIVFALTTMWRMILETGKLDEVDVSSVRCVVGGGERTPPSLFEELAKRGLYMQQGFGQTENSAMMLLPKEDIKRKMGSVGKPGYFTDIWIEDSKGKPLPSGEIGEIVAKGPTVMSGYWNLPEETKTAIVNGKLFTGDLGYTDEEGYFYIVDRAKDMYRSGGENVYPAEIEKILSNHPKISTAAIIGVNDDKWGETGLALILLSNNEIMSEKEVINFLTGKAAKYKHPKYIKFVDELPMTATMKVKKSVLKEKYKDISQCKLNN